MVKKIFPLWADEKEIIKLKEKAKAQNKSVSNFILNKTLNKKGGQNELYTKGFKK